MILINVSQQTLSLKNANEKIIATYSISTALKGVGEKNGSHQTPRGKHVICEMIGANRPIFTVFSARKPTGEIFSPELAKQFPNRDWILSRILWLAGCELGKNAGGDVDTKSRYIYIHGTDDEANIGTPNSHGCIRMRNKDIIELFDLVFSDMRVLISV
ncbi:MAG: L,D-transpeptidase [Gammaproteobacteria bacterium CG_4_10_14_0_8_um_filter_38_16]|nr:MAG: L,D-transpeptidase [Gammaproteobacteria bacterium CG_4_10_14_0_8_um_filter_38_16]PJA03550.1 MAG: L,D-transpeptidase [Gammaproteobacteria bacterium CG_4_10_14_0_2_um_filter_38_22]PJB10450.1 MAG: L,D-transpeptidase [Gammaproteobacteria bacterium CG_4_9_14_3_um_filter_38_9]